MSGSEKTNLLCTFVLLRFLTSFDSTRKGKCNVTEVFSELRYLVPFTRYVRFVRNDPISSDQCGFRILPYL